MNSLAIVVEQHRATTDALRRARASALRQLEAGHEVPSELLVRMAELAGRLEALATLQLQLEALT